MNLLRNQRGASVLTYVLFISTALLVLTPAILLTVSTAANNNQRDIQEKAAHNLAMSGIEALNSYLQVIPSNTPRVNYFESYPGFQAGEISYATPEGRQATYHIRQIDAGSNGLRNVISEATVGDQRAAISYQFTVQDPTAPVQQPNGDIDPNFPQRSDSIPQDLFYRDHVNRLPGSVVEYDRDFTSEIYEEVRAVETRVNAQFTEWGKLATSCTCNNTTELENAIKANNNNPIVIRLTNLHLSGTNTSYSWGTAERPVVLIVNELIMRDKNMSLNLVGSLLVWGQVQINNDESNINISKSGNNYGDLLVKGTFNYQANGDSKKMALDYIGPRDIEVDNLLYAQNFKAKNFVSAHTGQMVVNGNIDLGTDSSLKSDTSVYTGSMDVNNRAAVAANGGDIFAYQHINASNGSSTFTAGGKIAAAAFNANGQNTSFQVGGGWTAIQIGGGDPSNESPENNDTRWAPRPIIPPAS
jgi:hypothetical protein